MTEEVEATEIEEGGSAGWIVTFADLMSLLMCFFVLLLSFSEMDVLKFKQIAGSMRFAFGVQRTFKADDIPKGTSIVAQEFSPGKPTPTPIVELRQQTTDETKNNLDFTDSVMKRAKEEATRQLEEEAAQKLQENVDNLKQVLKAEVTNGLVEIEATEDEVMIRIREKGSFPSGSARLQRSFYPVLNKIGAVLNKVEGKIVVAGHTDDIPIATKQYPSNWLLSAARAATVVHYLSKRPRVAQARMQIRAHAENLPIVPNNSAKNRAKNRRVEIILNNKNALPMSLSDANDIVEISQ